MIPILKNRLEEIQNKYSEIEAKLLDTSINSDQRLSLSKEHAELSPIVQSINDLNSCIKEIADVNEILNENNLDNSIKQEAIKELNDLKQELSDYIVDSLDEDDEVYRQIYDAVNSFEEFRNIKKEASLIEYEDMIYDIWSLINSDSKILSLLEDKFKFIIIDEFQDNNFAFSEIINKIASHENITVVGDDDQSIYSFRGANSYNMHDFHKLYSSNPNYKKIELIKNYRSSQKILDVANSVIVNNDNRMEKEFLVSGLDIIKEDLVELCIGDFNSQLAELLKHIQALIKQKGGGEDIYPGLRIFIFRLEGYFWLLTDQDFSKSSTDFVLRSL